MTLNEYQQHAHVTSENTSIGDPIIYPTLGLVNEAGEFAGKVKKVFRDQGGIIDTYTYIALRAELGDILWYLAEAATVLHWSLEDVAADNLYKLSRRKENGTLHGDGDYR